PMSKGEVDALTAGETGGKPLSPQDHHLYRQILGKLMYAMVGSRPDLAHALSVLGRFAGAPDSFHLAMARRVLQYVKNTINFRMHYSARGSPANAAPLLGYVDSDFANSSDRKSITGFCFFQGPNLITWFPNARPRLPRLRPWPNTTLSTKLRLRRCAFAHCSRTLATTRRGQLPFGR